MRKGLITLILCLFAGCALAQDIVEEPDNSILTISTKQGFIIPWDSKEVKNLTTFEILKTKKVESWGKWNALWGGWSMDAGFAYDSGRLSDGGILLGRNFGTLGDYLPIEFPLKDMITITLYPAGLYLKDMFSDLSVKGCSGLGVIKFEIKF